MSFNLEQKVFNCLEKHPEQKMDARAIATWIFKTFPDECRKKQQRSKAIVTPLDTDSALIQQIVAEIGSRRPVIQKNHPQVKTTEGRPRKYYFTDKSDVREIEVAEESGRPSAEKDKLFEAELYPMLAEYLYVENQNIYSKRIDEKKSSNARGPNGNKWLYPDIVALEDLTNEWTREVKECVQQCSDKKSRLWSFEVKLLINRSNVREVYFQALSNSSWANFGYLVAGDIQGTETIKELRMLSSAHDIGVIKLDVENPAESQIIVPAVEKYEVDWDAANRLALENKDFRDYLQLIKEFYQTGNPRKKEWDIP